MIEKYQELLNECIDIQENNKMLSKAKDALKTMKGNLEVIKNKMGKHSQEYYIEQLENTIRLRDEEIRDIKNGCAEEFEKIKNLCFCNEYNGKLDNRKKLIKIHEIAEENYSMLLKDLAIDEVDEEEKSKIIELASRPIDNKF